MSSADRICRFEELGLVHVYASGSVFRAANGIRCKRQRRVEFAEASELEATKTRNISAGCCATSYWHLEPHPASA